MFGAALALLLHLAVFLALAGGDTVRQARQEAGSVGTMIGELIRTNLAT